MRTVGGNRQVDGSDPDHERDDEPMCRFRSLYERTFSDIYAYATRALVPDRSEIDDVVAEVYLVAWRRIDELPPSPQDRLWLFGVTRNVVRNTRRSAHRRHRLVDRIHRQPHPSAGSSEPAAVDVTHALQRLSTSEREVMQLVVWEGLSPAEAAEVLHCSVNVVQVRLHRARRRLANRLQVGGGRPGGEGEGDSGDVVTGVDSAAEATARQLDTENRQ